MEKDVPRNNLRFLVVGLGSMGKRRIRNLQFLGHTAIIGFDPRADRRKEVEDTYKIRTYETFEAALGERPDAIVISTPPNYHVQYATEAAKRGIHFFMEVTVGSGLDELAKLCKNKKIVAAPSSTLRFKQSVRKIKELIGKKTIGKVLAFNYHMGQYLPDWHPWESIKSFYVGRRETGACREMFCFETSWLTWIFGEVAEVSTMKGKFSKLDVDIDDIYASILKFGNGVLGVFLLDVVSRVPYRQLRIIGEEGVIEWEFDKVRLYTAQDKGWTEFKDEEKVVQKNYWAKDDMYIEEMRHFVNAVEGKEKYVYSLEEDAAIYTLLLAAEASSDTKKVVTR